MEHQQQPNLVGLPAELVLQIFTYLEPLDLASVAQTCKAFTTHSYDDQIWQPLINRNLPDPITEPAPLTTFRELYAAHHPYWFLTKYRLWFGDGEHQGKLVAARYDPRNGCIEAYTVAAQRGRHTLQFWEKDREVIIHSFDPKVVLDLGKPVLKLDVGSLRTNEQPNNEPSDRAYALPSVYSKEVVMETPAEAGLFSAFMLCRALPRNAIGEQTAIWPPRRFPTPKHVRNDTRDGYHSAGHRPTRLDEVSEYHWRLRKWVEFTGRRASASIVTLGSIESLSAALGIGGPYFAGNLASSAADGMSIRMPEDVTTFSTAPEWCWKPTPQKPWQGLWCGDYSGHGCEFLLVLQPDKEDERPLPEGMDWLREWFSGGRRGSGSSEGSYASAQEDLGSLQASSGALEQTAPKTHAERVALEDDAVRNALRAATERTYQAERWDAEHQVIPHSVLAGFTEGVAGPSTALPIHRSITEAVISEPANPDEPSGRLEGIKLTGDPNIPRGEYTFVAPDIGEGGFLRVADEEIFKGARIVRSAGHIAGRGFRDDQYTPSQLIMVSHDRLAQFWEGFGHISYFQRVDVDALIKYTG